MPRLSEVTQAQLSKRYTRKIDEIRKRAVRMDKDTVIRARRLARSLTTELKREIALAERWEAAYLPELKRALDARIAAFDLAVKDLANGQTRTGWDIGTAMVDEPMSAAEIRLALTDLSDTQLIVSQEMTADLITGISAEARRAVSNAVSLSVIGEETPYQAAQKIDKIIGAKVDRGITYRAESIIRTESKRAQSVATMARMEQAKQQAPTLKKQWLSSGKLKPRPNHAAIDGQVREIDEPFDIPGVRVKPMYPLDPILPAEEVINCGCDMTTYVPELEEAIL